MAKTVSLEVQALQEKIKNSTGYVRRKYIEYGASIINAAVKTMPMSFLSSNIEACLHAHEENKSVELREALRPFMKSVLHMSPSEGVEEKLKEQGTL